MNKPYREPAHLRFMHDPHFHSLVEMMTKYLVEHRFSPSEMREAAVLACVHYEQSKTRWAGPIPEPEESDE